MKHRIVSKGNENQCRVTGYTMKWIIQVSGETGLTVSLEWSTLICLLYRGFNNVSCVMYGNHPTNEGECFIKVILYTE